MTAPEQPTPEATLRNAATTPLPGDARLTEDDWKRAAKICREVAELPDRTSPEENADFMLVTGDELQPMLAEAFAEVRAGASSRAAVVAPGDAGERALMQRALEIIYATNEWIGSASVPSVRYRAHLQRHIAAALQSERTDAASQIAKLIVERDDAQFHVRDMVATNAAMAAERDRANNNLEHWRHEVGKLQSQIETLKAARPAAASQARREAALAEKVIEAARELLAQYDPQLFGDGEAELQRALAEYDRALATPQESASCRSPEKINGSW